jgi:hypothetical protein
VARPTKTVKTLDAILVSKFGFAKTTCEVSNELIKEIWVDR